MFGRLKRMARSIFGGSNRKSTRRGRSTRPGNRYRTTTRNRRTPARSYRRR